LRRAALRVACAFLFMVLMLGTWSVTGEHLPRAQADDSGVTVSPAKMDLDIVPGRTTHGSFTVVNNSAQASPVTIYAAPFNVTDASYETIDFSKRSAHTQLVDWVRFDQDVYVFKGHEQKTIDFMVECPPDATPGGQYVALFAQINPSAQEGSGVAATRRVGCLVYGTVAGQAQAAGDVRFAGLPWLHLGGPLPTSLDIQNLGNVGFTSSYQLVASPRFLGHAYDSSAIEQQNASPNACTVLPGTTRAITQTWDDPAPGLYEVTRFASHLGQFYTEQSSVLVCPLWVIIVASTVLASAVFLAVYLPLRRHRRNKRRRKAQDNAFGAIP
jgi:hypothetical protein